MKREGDGTTPIGAWPLREVRYRADQVIRPVTRMRVRPLQERDGWCDAPADCNYNREVRHPYPASAERLWRTDRIYDLVLVLGYNDTPRRRGRGSAVFLHLAREHFAPTEGCVALSPRDARLLLARVGPASRLIVPG
jgi:L,D-peptidoglycan transpeptidase YkuD (ErfK/YbiS/YcfS/YnhG family)